MLKKYYNFLNSSSITIEDYELHHIIPKSLFKFRNELGFNSDINEIDDPSNIIKLKLSDHFEAHRILVDCFRNKNENAYQKMLFAFNMMCKTRKFNGELYSTYRLEFKNMMRQILTGNPSRAKGYKWSDEQRQNKKEKHPGKNKSHEEYYSEESHKKIAFGRDNTFNNPIFDQTLHIWQNWDYI